VLSAESKNERLTPLSMRWRVGSLHVCVVIAETDRTPPQVRGSFNYGTARRN
jgi:hypothetical protein